jgi:ParB family chromosome partitioning protein
MFEEARTVRAMMDMCNMTQAEAAQKLGVTQSYVANKLRLLKLSDRVMRAVTDNGLCERHARALLRLNGDEVILGAIEIIRARRLTVLEAEALVDMLRERRAEEYMRGITPRERLESFYELIDGALRGLRSVGIGVRREESYYGNKKYITILIDDYKSI